jgi:carbon monoxide dehydrogenase subunit G
MKIEDQFSVDKPIEAVWVAITDPDIVGPCLPGCEEIEVLSPTKYSAQIKAQVGPIKVRFKVEVEVTEEDPPNRIVSVTRGDEGGKASNVRADNILTLSSTNDGGTLVAYSSDVTVTGRIAKFGFGVMKKKAQSIGREFADTFRERIAGEGTADG